MKKIFYIIVAVLMCIICDNHVYAMSGRLDKIDYIYNTYNTNGSNSYSRNSSYKLYVDDILTYCVTPGVLFKTGDGYFEGEYTNISPNDIYKMELISYYGYHDGYHNSFEYYLATQEMIHNVLGYTTTYNYGSFDVEAYKNEINRSIAMHDVVPNISDDVYVLPYKTYTYVDSNNVLTSYRIETSSNVSYSINSNVLTIYLSDDSDGYINFYKGDDDKTRFYLKDDSQIVANFSLPKKVMKTINIHKLDSGMVEVFDYDRSTNTGIFGSTYNLVDSSNNVLETKTTDENGYLIYDNYYEYGNYKVIEVSSNSLMQDVLIDDKIETVRFYHGEIGNISINNIGVDGKELNGIFDIYKDGNYVYDWNNLTIGNYQIKQVSAQDGYIKDDNIYNISLTRDNMHQSVTIINDILRGSVDIYNYDENGNILNGVFEVKSLDGVVCNSSDLTIGKYYIHQISSQDGYYVDDSIYEVDITSSDLHKELVIINKKILGSIDVKIVDQDGNKLNCNYMIYDKNNNIYNGNNLIPGTYYVKQIDSVYGYYMDDKAHRVIVKKDDLHKELVIVNKLITGSITVSIVDEEGSKLTGKYVIYDDNNNEYSGKKIKIGTYHVKQTSSKKGYYIDDNVYDINIDVSDLNKELIIVNKLITGSIRVDIVTENGDKIDGTYEILKDGKKYTSTNLSPGIYQVKQLTTSYGYLICDDIYDVEITLDNLNKELIITNKKMLGSINVKIINDYDEEIGGKYIIYDENGIKYDGTNLDLGVYFVKQVSSVTDYEIDDSIYEININPDNLNQDVLITNKYILEIIPKTSDNNYIFIYPLIVMVICLVLRLQKES